MKILLRSKSLAVVLLGLSFLFLAGCSSLNPRAENGTSLMLSDLELPSLSEGVPVLPVEEILLLDDAMRSWVREKIRGVGSPQTRMRNLVSGLIAEGLFNLEYNENETYTARETFHRRRGNCLSFSILFVALAREADLDARFQLVDVPLSFSSAGELILLNNHINVVVSNVRDTSRFVRDHVVDFNTAVYKGDHTFREVSDENAFALFYSNLGVKMLRKNEYSNSYLAIRRSIELKNNIPGPWVNLGVLLSRIEEPQFALAAYHQALNVSPSNKSAMVNLARLNSQLGNKAEAAYYQSLIESYIKRNPYYFYEKAKVAYGTRRYEDAIGLLEKSIRLRRDEHQFYFLRAISYLALNDLDAAKRNLRLAERNSSREALAQRYQYKIGLLNDQALNN